MKENPCRSCERLRVDKNSDECIQCAKRLRYVGAIGPTSEGIPVEMTDMARKPWTEQDIEYLRNHYRTKTDTQIGEELGRSTGTVVQTRFKLGLHRESGWKAGADRLRERKIKSAPHRPKPAAKMTSSDQALQRDVAMLEAAEQDKAREEAQSTSSQFAPWTCPHCGKGIRLELVRA